MTREEVLTQPAGNRLDAWVAEAVFGESVYLDSMHRLWRLGTERRTARGYPPDYSTDIAAAWKVVEEMRKRVSNLKLALYAANGWCCYLWDVTAEGTEVEKGVSGNTPTAPLAICRAALLATMT